MNWRLNDNNHVLRNSVSEYNGVTKLPMSFIITLLQPSAKRSDCNRNQLDFVEIPIAVWLVAYERNTMIQNSKPF